MKIKTINYHKVFNLGNYQNEKIGVEIALEENEDPIQAHMEAVKFVERANKFQSLVPKYMKAKEVVQDTLRYTGYQVEEAKGVIADFETNFKDYIAAYSNEQLKEIEAKRSEDPEPEEDQIRF